MTVPAPKSILAAGSTLAILAICKLVVFAGSSLVAQTNEDCPFAHPGLLHSREDFERMRVKVDQTEQPWVDGWRKLLGSRHASLTWKPNPQPIVYRGADGRHPENYSSLFNDAAAAYALALRWKITGDDAYADKAIAILDGWSSTLTAIKGTSDRYLASGIYGTPVSTSAIPMTNTFSLPTRYPQRRTPNPAATCKVAKSKSRMVKRRRMGSIIR